MEIAIIGAGPRGLMTLSRLISWNQKLHYTDATTITVIDYAPIGGRTWAPDQSPILVMNTVTSQVTLFTDSSVQMQGDVDRGPTLFEWLHGDEIEEFIKSGNYVHGEEYLRQAADLGPDDYASRGLFGVYCQWFYHQLQLHHSRNLAVHFQQMKVNALQPTEQGYQITTTQQIFFADRVIMAIDSTDMNQLSAESQSLADYAKTNDLTYVGPTMANEVDLSVVNADQPVILEGMGLTFYDDLALMTIGRGGKFVESENGLTYQPSGKEPKVYAGSILGVPYYPKAINRERYGEQATPHFYTRAAIDQYDSDHPMPYEQFTQLLRQELLFQYYTRLIKSKYPKINLDEFDDQVIGSENPIEVMENFPFKPEDKLNFDQVLNPVAGLKISDTDHYNERIKNWLARIINDANQGTEKALITGMLNTLFELRDNVRYMVEKRVLSHTDYVNRFLTEYNVYYHFLISGPPVFRSEELLVLMNAGIVTVLGPQLKIIGANSEFIAYSKFYPKEFFRAKTVISAFDPSFNAHENSSSLINSIKQNQLGQAALLDNHQLKALTIDPKNDQLTYQNQPTTNLFFWGQGTETIHWLTQTTFHPGTNDSNIQTADRIAYQVLTDKALPFINQPLA